MISAIAEQCYKVMLLSFFFFFFVSGNSGEVYTETNGKSYHEQLENVAVVTWHFMADVQYR